jgi:hypothetical protein
MRLKAKIAAASLGVFVFKEKNRPYLPAVTHKSRLVSSGWLPSALLAKADIR